MRERVIINMKTKTIQLFEFSELSKEAQDKVLDKHRDINTDFDSWYEDDFLLDGGLDEEIKKKFSNEGNTLRVLKDKKPIEVLFSWENLYFDLDRGCYIQFNDLSVNDEDLFFDFLKIPARLRKHIFYSFENNREYNTKLDIEILDLKGKSKDEEVLERARNIFDDLIHKSFKSLREQYNYLLSDEAVKETIEANEYDFLESGEIFR